MQATEAVEANSRGGAGAASRLTALDRRDEEDCFVPGGAGGEVTEELFNISSGWSLEVLGDSDDEEARPSARHCSCCVKPSATLDHLASQGPANGSS